MILLESSRGGDSNKYTKRMIYIKKMFKRIRYSYIERFFKTANLIIQQKSLVTNTVVITMVFFTFTTCIVNLLLKTKNLFHLYVRIK